MTLHMSRKELDRLDIIRRLIRKEMNGTKAAELLSLSTRQIRTLKKNVQHHGPQGLIHGNRGRRSNHRLPAQHRTRIATLLEKRYADFGPTFASEKLAELHGITHDPKTIRQIMIDGGLWKPRKGKRTVHHHQWRKRKDCVGEMVQFDGSYHDWLEGRGETKEQCLLAAIDDAGSRVTHAVFAEHEGVLPVMGFWKEYILTNGIPRCIYLDKFSTYKVNHKTAKENPDVKTQFQRACHQLGIQPIFANSPQAKGRVERLFKTLQDRLVKELRLAGISHTDDANTFLLSYLPTFNARFAVEPAAAANLHRPLMKHTRKNIDSIFARQNERIVHNDFTISHNSQWYQLLETPGIIVRKKDVVTVEERLNGTIHICLRGKEISYTILPARPKKAAHTTPWVLAPDALHKPYKPAMNHPWRKAFLVKPRTATSNTNS